MAVEDVASSDLRPTVRHRQPTKFAIGDHPNLFDENETGAEFRESSPTNSSPSPEHKPLSSAMYKGFFDFFFSEISRGYDLENDEARYTEKRKKVYAFIKIPKELEKFLFYGLLQCTDAFLYIFTFLPLRFLMALYHLIVRWLCYFGRGKRIPASASEICDILKVSYRNLAKIYFI